MAIHTNLGPLDDDDAWTEGIYQTIQDYNYTQGKVHYTLTKDVQVTATADASVRLKRTMYDEEFNAEEEHLYYARISPAEHADEHVASLMEHVKAHAGFLEEQYSAPSAGLIEERSSPPTR